MPPPDSVFPGWRLDFYDFSRPLASVEDLVAGCDEVLARAKRNGAKQGTSFFLDPSGRADARVNAFWRSPGVRGLGEETQRRYAFSLKVWLDFCDAVAVAWHRAGRGELAAFKEWRMSAADNPDLVAESQADARGGPTPPHVTALQQQLTDAHHRIRQLETTNAHLVTQTHALAAIIAEQTHEIADDNVVSLNRFRRDN